MSIRRGLYPSVCDSLSCLSAYRYCRNY